MWVSQEHIGPLIFKKIQMYILTRAELLFTLCYEIPCMKHTVVTPSLLFKSSLDNNGFYSPLSLVLRLKVFFNNDKWALALDKKKYYET